MNAEETVTPASAPISDERRLLALESVWELEALREHINDLCDELGRGDQTQDYLMTLRLKVRGLTIRMGQLSCVVLSVLEDDDSTGNLYKVVHGRRRPSDCNGSPLDARAVAAE